MDIKEQIVEIVAEILEMDSTLIDSEQDLYEMEGFDSMRNVMILDRIEETFEVMIPEDDIFDITNINEWVEEIIKLKK